MRYNYDRHAKKLIDTINLDYTLAMGPSVQCLGLHYGNLEAIDAAFANVVEAAARARTLVLDRKRVQLGRRCVGAITCSPCRGAVSESAARRSHVHHEYRVRSARPRARPRA